MTKHPYEDILHRQRPEPIGRLRMPLTDRAAQFAPFAALTGYDRVIAETGRLTVSRVELEEQEKQHLDRCLNLLYRLGEAAPRVRITHFVPDCRKNGGVYLTKEGRIRRILPHRGLVQMEDGNEISFEQIVKISFPDQEAMEEFV